VCVATNNFERIGRFHKIQQRGHTIAGDLDDTFLSLNFNHSKMAKIQTSEVDAKLEPFNVGP
jgi:hypothetical protein